jgi:hypothetical protein
MHHSRAEQRVNLERKGLLSGAFKMNVPTREQVTDCGTRIRQIAGEKGPMVVCQGVENGLNRIT